MANNYNPYDSYEPASARDANLRPFGKRLVAYLLIGLAVELFLYVIAIISLGFGHGSDNVADFLFPISNALFGGNFSERPFPVAIIDNLQYVCYFGLLGVASAYKKFGLGLSIVLFTHACALVF
jgi:hypothetical protein